VVSPQIANASLYLEKRFSAIHFYAKKKYYCFKKALKLVATADRWWDMFLSPISRNTTGPALLSEIPHA
jgi:hypothetical protein